MRLIGRLAAFWRLGAAFCPSADAMQIAAAAVVVIQISQNHRIRSQAFEDLFKKGHQRRPVF
jgi:hypothetical protein